MKRFFAVLLLAALAPALAPQSSEIDRAIKTIRALDIQRHQAFLASDELEGREAGSDGGQRAALHIADHLASLGFEGGASDGGYFQPFGGGSATGDLADANLLRLYKDTTRRVSEDFKLGAQLTPYARSRAGSAEGAVVFAGYGITAPEFGYDDWKGATVKGAIALVLDGEPQEADEQSKFDGTKPTKYSELEHKIQMAEKAGAVALLVASREGLAKRPEFAWPPDGKSPPVKVPVALVSAELADRLAGKPLKNLRAEIDADLKPRSIKGAPAAEISLSARPIPGKGTKNILAVWRGIHSKLKEEFVVLGAHYDHVGRGTPQNSRGKVGEIHNGADDNASGTSTLLDIAEAVKETRPKRSILLMWFDAEEKGLVGSNNWCGSPTVPLDHVVAMLNMDMIGRNDTTKILLGVEKEGKEPRYPKLAAALAQTEQRFRLKFDWEGADDLIRRSDHWSFMEKGVPAVFFTGGLHADYHTERDDIERINFPKEELVGKIVFWLAEKIANSDQSLR
ncbi:MAG TPA: M28 family peptidase [Planctomycetota bacterium]|nr:M28 family peptidase [Planctomycetota bacterium]